MSTVIELKGVSKLFQDIEAIRTLDLSIQQKESVAIIGPNGAGKTTLISLMLGLLQPTMGRVSIWGKEANQAQAKIGVMLQQSNMLEDVKVRELVDLIRSFYPNPMRRQEVLEKVQLEEVADQYAYRLSGGQKRRLSFALAIVGNPDLLFFDEPTVGMNVTSRKLFMQELMQLKQEGKTILFTTHYLEEVEEVADRIVMLAKGKKVSEGTLSTLMGRYARESVSFQDIDDVMINWDEIPYIIDQEKQGGRIILYTEHRDALIQELVKREIPLSDVRMEKGKLQDVFEEFVKGGTEE